MNDEPTVRPTVELEMARLIVRACAWYFKKKPGETISYQRLWDFISEQRTAAEMQSGVRCAIDQGWLESLGVDLVLTEAGTKAV